MIKTLLASLGAVVFAASTMQAAPARTFGGARGSFTGAQARPSANYSHAYGSGGRYGYNGGRFPYHGGYRGGGYRHRYYYGGIPYFYDPFFFGFGYYGGLYGSPYGYGPYGNDYYNGRIADNRNNDTDGNQDPSALPKEVQRQLSKRGYYKGSIDGEFGPASKSALTRFQRDNDLRATGRVDGATLKALGFEDRGDSSRD